MYLYIIIPLHCLCHIPAYSHGGYQRWCEADVTHLQLLFEFLRNIYIKYTVYYIGLNNEGLKQNLAKHDYKTWNRSDFQTQFCRTNIFKKSVNNLGTKLYNKLPNYLKNLENSKLFKKQLKAFLLQQNFYSVDLYLYFYFGSIKSRTCR